MKARAATGRGWGECTYVEDLLVAQSLGHRVLAVVKCILPRVKQEGQAELPGRVLFQCLTNGDEVLQRFGHFAAVNVQVAGVQEVMHPVAVSIGSLSKEQESSHQEQTQLCLFKK